MYTDETAAGAAESVTSRTAITDGSGKETEDKERIILDFLNYLYGEYVKDGYLVLWTKQDKRAHFFPGNEFEDAAQMAQLLCDQMDVYYGVGLQKEIPDDGGRGGANGVVCIPGLWLDVDVAGPNHREKDLPPDDESVKQLINSFDLKPTMAVKTSGGFHVYWLFKSPLIIKDENDRKEAQCLSNDFQSMFLNLAAKKGWTIDNISPLSQLLRLPGTFNHKQKRPVLVELNFQSDECRYDPAEITEVLN